MQQGSNNYLDGGGRNIQMKMQQKEIIAAINQMTNGEIIPEKYDERVVKNRIIREKVKSMTQNLIVKVEEVKHDYLTMSEDLLIFNKTVPNVHIFYYLPIKWYASENHTVFQLNTVFYPKRGLYNYSTNEYAKRILREHFEEIRTCGIGTVIICWEPYNDKLNDMLPIIFHLVTQMNKEAHENNQLKLTIQIGSYQERTVESIRNNIKFFVDNFTNSPSFLKINSLKRPKTLPLFYVKDAEHVKDWSKLLSPKGIITIRNTNYDSIILAHLESKESKQIVRKSNFDGFYTFNASNGASYFSTFKNWEKLKKFADMYNLIFVPTVSPGYYDSEVKFNSMRRFRSNGMYFELGFRTALLQHTEFISIESYNNFVHGTQIEAVLPFGNGKFKDYSPQSPFKYLEISQHWTNQFYRNKIDKLKHNDKKMCQHFTNNTIC